MQLIVPTFEKQQRDIHPAPSPGPLSGRTVGIISNGKTNTIPFFDELERRLVDEWGVAEVIRRLKPNYSAPAGADLMDEAATWAVMFAGIGD